MFSRDGGLRNEKRGYFLFSKETFSLHPQQTAFLVKMCVDAEIKLLKHLLNCKNMRQKSLTLHFSFVT